MATIRIDHSRSSSAKAIVQERMRESAVTLAAHDVDAYLELISKYVKVHGVPELETLDYNDWAIQIRHEFANTLEVITASDGMAVRNGLEVGL